MRYFDGVSGAAKRIRPGFLALGLAVLVSGIAQTFAPGLAGAVALTDSNSSVIQATLCSETDELDFSILEPQDGTVFTSNPVGIRAGVSDLSTATLSVNGTIITTVMLGETAESFEAAINLPAGNHNVKLTGYDLCGREFASTTLSLTMKTTAVQPQPEQPKSPDSTDTPTVAQAGLGQPVSAPTAEDVVVYHSTDPATEPRDPAAGTGVLMPNDDESGAIGGGPEGGIDDWLNPGPTFENVANFTRAAAGISGALLFLNSDVAALAAREALQLYLFRRGGTKLQKRKFFKQHLKQFRFAAQGLGALLLAGMFVV